MALFRGQILYLRATTHDVTFGTDVRALLGTAGADTDFTITYTSTTAATQTVDPYTNISNVTADNRLNLGWALNQNEVSTDGMGSSPTRKRIIPAGTWQFSNSIAGTAPPLTADYNVTVEYSVYRVDANGGTRTLLFSFSGAAINRTDAGTFTASATSPEQPVYIFEPNETIHIAYRITSAATSSVLGGTTNTVLTINGATSGSQSVTLPAPGLRDLYIDSSSAVGEGAGLESILARKDTIAGIGEGAGTELIRVRKDTITGIGEGSGSYDYLAEFFRSLNGTGSGDAERALLVLVKDTINALGSGVGTRSNLVRKDVITGIGEGGGLESKQIFKDIISAEGASVADLMRAAVFVRDFLGEGASVADIARVVIFVLDFLGQGKGQVRPRIALDWDDLPNNYRPLFVFDD